jgi:alpha-tubulin suppressor-like RCC1 family protein
MRTLGQALVLPLLIFACKGSSTGPKAETPMLVASVEVDPLNGRVHVGTSLQLTATTKDVDGDVLTGRTISWSSNDAFVATVSNAGLVLGVGVGGATVTATCEGKTGTGLVTVWEGSFHLVNAGSFHTCGVFAAGEAYCWGWGRYGQLGNGSTPEYQLVPALVAGGLTFASVSPGGGGATCGVTTVGEVYCWGSGLYGQLGNGSLEDQLVPVLVGSGLTFSSVSAGGGWICGVSTVGEAYCWGSGLYGQLGNGSLEDQLVPTLLAGGLTFAAVSAGSRHTCGVTAAGRAYCWGENQFGQLGIGSLENRPVPVLVAGGLTFASVSAGHHHTCGVTTTGKAYCWGSDDTGQLGNGSLQAQLEPGLVAGGLTFASVSAGGAQTCGVTTAGKAYCWGAGALGNGSWEFFEDSPTAVSGGLTFSSVSAGYGHTCGVADGSEVYCWGSGQWGQLGNGSTESKNVPTALTWGGLGLQVVAGR